MTKLTKAEREELRRLHDYASGRFTMRINGENDCRVELANGPSDDERGLHARFRYATGAHAFVAIHNHLPRLLADLDAAEAERDIAIADRIIADSDAWVALGKPGGTHDTTCVQRLCEQFAEVKGERDALKAKLAAAESAHSELFLSGQVAELRGKLAAVVAAYDHVFGDFDHSALSVDARILFDAIAAARGGAS